MASSWQHPGLGRFQRGVVVLLAGTGLLAAGLAPPLPAATDDAVPAIPDPGAELPAGATDESASPDDPARKILRGQDEGVEPTGRVIVGPTQISLGTVRPGQVVTVPVKITSRLDTVATIRIGSRGVVTPDDDATATYAFVEPGSEEYADTAAPWIAPALRETELGPGEWIQVPVTINVPEAAPPGGHFGAVVIQPEISDEGADDVDGDGEDGTRVGVVPEIGLLVLAAVEGNYRTEFELADLSAPRFAWGHDTWKITADIHNAGEAYARYGGDVTVKGITGSVIERFDMQTRLILPGGTRTATATWEQTPWLGFYRISGRLTADSEIGDDIRFSTWLITVPPWWMLLAAAVVIGGALRWWLHVPDDASYELADDPADDDWDR